MNISMKKIFIAIVAIIGLLMAFPFVFKDSIKAKVTAAINQQIDAQVYYKYMGISLFRHFPSLTVSLNDFGVVGNSPFKSDTLVKAQKFDVSFDVRKLFSGNYQIHHIGLEKPAIKIKVLQNGQANYNIVKPSGKPSTTEEKPTELNLKIDAWQITDGELVYDNRQKPAYIHLQNIQHNGSGDLAQDLFDLQTNTHIEKVDVSYGGTDYMRNRSFDADLTLAIDSKNKSYTFKDNQLKVNDFALNFKGHVQLPDTNTVVIDLSYQSPNNDFKNLLSLVPTIYTEKFGDIKAEGKVGFDGYVKGTYQATQTPMFGFNLKVENSQFQYPNLPTPVSGVNIDLHVNNKTPQIANTEINLNQFTANLGNNPINAKANIALQAQGNGYAKKINAEVLAKLNLEEVSKIFPVEGLSMRGLYNLDLKANGLLDSLHFPLVNAAMTLKNGYVKSKNLPKPIENLQVSANVLNQSGTVADTRINLNQLSMMLDNDPFTASGIIQNLNNYTWDIKAKGKLDLTKITKIYPLTDMTLKGLIDADIETQGQMADVKAKRYANLPTSGKATISNLVFVSKDYPQGIKISQASLNFTPQTMTVSQAQGYLGQSDFVASGSMSNYIGYALNNETLHGQFNVKSNKFNVNEWMTDQPQAKGGTAQAPLQVVEVPKNIDFKLNAQVAETIYDKMPIKDATGTLVVGNGAVKMQNVSFNSLGGRFNTSGTYDTQNIVHPTFDFALNLENIEIPQAYQHLTFVKIFVPIAEYMIGNLSSKLKLSGELLPDMMPNMRTLSGDGLVKVIKATLAKEDNILARIVDLAKLKDLKDKQLKDVNLQANIDNGSLVVQPFDVRWQDYKMTINGTNTLDGSLDYTFKMDVPSGTAGAAFQQAFSRWTGKTLTGADRVKFDLKATGNVKSPKIAFNGSSTANSLKDVANTQIEQAKAKAMEEANKLKTQAEAEKQRIIQETETKIQAEKDRLLKEANAQKAILEARAKAYADSLKKVAAQKARQEINKQKSRILDGFLKKPKKDSL
jgi:AsmA-like C-terminal region/AsmA family